MNAAFRERFGDHRGAILAAKFFVVAEQKIDVARRRES